MSSARLGPNIAFASTNPSQKDFPACYKTRTDIIDGSVLYLKKQFKIKTALEKQTPHQHCLYWGNVEVLAKRHQTRMPGGVRLCSLSDCCHHGQAESWQAEGCPTKSKGTMQKRCKASQFGPVCGTAAQPAALPSQQCAMTASKVILQ